MLQRRLVRHGYEVETASSAAEGFALMERIHPGFLDYFFVDQHFRRFSVGGFNNPQPVWFYPAVLVLFFLPWLIWIGRRVALWRMPAGRERDLVLLAWVWVAVIVVLVVCRNVALAVDTDVSVISTVVGM